MWNEIPQFPSMGDMEWADQGRGHMGSEKSRNRKSDILGLGSNYILGHQPPPDRFLLRNRNPYLSGNHYLSVSAFYLVTY